MHSPTGALICLNVPWYVSSLATDNHLEILKKEHRRTVCKVQMSAAARTGESIKLKICLAGEREVGKTSLVRRFVFDTFDDRYLATMGAKVTKRVLTLTMPGTEKRGHVDLTIWDIMGEKGFRELLKEAYFRGSQGILAVCDVTRPDSLVELRDWREAIEKVAGRIPAFVLANKFDLVEETMMGESDVEAFATSWRSPYLLTSAKTGENVKEAFAGLTLRILEGPLQHVHA